MNLKITIEGDLACDAEERMNFMGMMYGNNSFRALSDFRSFLRDRIKYGEGIEVEIYEKCLEHFNSCLDNENIHGIFYDIYR